MTSQSEFLDQFVELILSTFTTSEEEMIGFGKGFHLALGCMIHHPEWAQAAFKLLEEDTPKTETVAGYFVKHLPIDMR